MSEGSAEGEIRAVYGYGIGGFIDAGEPRGDRLPLADLERNISPGAEPAIEYPIIAETTDLQLISEPDSGPTAEGDL